MDEKFEKRMDKLEDEIWAIRKILEITFERYTTAWIHDRVEYITKEKGPPGSYTSDHKIVDVDGFMTGTKGFEVDLDVYGTSPLHVVAEYKSVITSHDANLKRKALEKVQLFCKKVKFLEHRVGTAPLAFFCVGDIDPSLVSEINTILDIVGAILVAFVQKDDEISPAIL